MKRILIPLALSLLPAPVTMAAELPAATVSLTQGGASQLAAWDKLIDASIARSAGQKASNEAEAAAEAAKIEARAAIKSAAQARDRVTSGDLDSADANRAADDAETARSRAKAEISKAIEVYMATATTVIALDDAIKAFQAAQENALSSYVLAPGETVADRRTAGGSEGTRAPFGWYRLCVADPAQCAPAPESDGHPVVLTGRAWRDLVELNRWVNGSVKAITDMDHWGVVEKWSLPSPDDMRGDCEDYVLLKRKLLIDAGWPVGALLIAVVRDLKNLGHAVLLVRTDIGDFVLDNMRDPVLLAKETGYVFIKRQSDSDPNLWVWMRPPSMEFDGLFAIRLPDTRRVIRAEVMN